MAAYESSVSVVSHAPKIASDEMVLTIPGFLAGRCSMRRIDDALCEMGYQTRHWNYASLRGSIVDHAARLSRDLCELAESTKIRRIHFVTHSMGSVIARAAIHDSRLETRFHHKCGRIVMLAPPNAGSRLTRIPLGPFAPFFPQLIELSETPASYVRCLPPFQHISVGVIAAERDFVVNPDATHLSGERDHVTLPTTHQGLLADPDAIEMAIRFLKSERLESAPTTIPFPRVAQRRSVHSAAA
ncbi:esterase/lipase family protein [Aporhodopirellula aestuarii]|uniref:Alpha/beta fold hydrolase n=1 Tax=Aporhodopirellula aestuarii TaxID=2950107 RepID=A0ABT0U222_9BACT|nr:alpha/beta fold hydrolase [Aporhodopirellula aestuarii]MCM2370922.1 alpha/beta fold hydrolase [Aporhodopirellula aestuarii]